MSLHAGRASDADAGTKLSRCGLPLAFPLNAAVLLALLLLDWLAVSLLRALTPTLSQRERA